MGAIGLALLAEPIKGYYADRDFIQNQQQQIARLEQLYRQQEELLANADNPSVIERAAVSNFNYTPLPEKDRASMALPKEWPDLKEALAQTDQVSTTQSAPSWRQWIEKLADQPSQQVILMALGAALVVIGLACFYRLR